MAQLPTPVECGRQVLSIYKSMGIRAEQILLLQNLRRGFLNPPWHEEDLIAGLKWCISQGYLREGKPHAYFLTAKGFESL